MSFLSSPYINFGSLPAVTELARDTTRYSNTNNLNIYTSDARSIGAASATRKVYALFGFLSGTVRTVSSVTIGGVSASVEVSVTRTDGEQILAAIYSAIVPTGTTAVVEVTLSGSAKIFACSVIALDTIQVGTVDSATASIDTGVASTGAALDLEDDGYGMAVGIGWNSSGNAIAATWTELTESADDDVSDGVDERVLGYSTAYEQPTADEAGATVTLDWTNSGSKLIAAISVR